MGEVAFSTSAWSKRVRLPILRAFIFPVLIQVWMVARVTWKRSATSCRVRYFFCSGRMVRILLSKRLDTVCSMSCRSSSADRRMMMFCSITVVLLVMDTKE